jgi:hypothetical protein
MVAWWNEIERWTMQCQISLPVVLRNAGVWPAVFPFHQIIGNPWTKLHMHADGSL